MTFSKNTFGWYKPLTDIEKISLEEINELWRETDMSGGIEFNRTTFSRHKDAIQDIFCFFIEYDRMNDKYYIW